jgi:uncharacterized protein
MHIIYIDADACPVKDEVYRVAHRYEMRVVVASKTSIMTPTEARIELVVRPGFGEVDDWIAEQAGPGDIVVTADIPLAARCIAKNARVLDPRGRLLTENEIGEVLGMRDLMTELRQTGVATGGPSPMVAKDRSRFLSKLDETINAVRRAFASNEKPPAS